MSVPSRNPGRSGTALVAVVAGTVLLFGFLASLVGVSIGAGREQRSQAERTRAFYNAEAALNLACAAVLRGDSGAVASEQSPWSFGGGSTYVEEFDLGDGATSLISVSDFGGERLVLQAITTEDPPEPELYYSQGMFGDDGVVLHSNAVVDAYDSSVPWADSAADRETSQVGSNADVTVESGSEIQGDARPGPSSEVVYEGGSVTGSTSSNTELVTLPSITVPSYGSSGSLWIEDDLPAPTISSGDHRYDSLTMESNSSIAFEGPANIVIGSFDIGSGAEIWVDATNGPVNFYFPGYFHVGSNVVWQSTAAVPDDVRILLSSSGWSEIGSGGEIHGAILAPDANLRIGSNTVVYGAIGSNILEIGSGAHMHYDLALSALAAAQAEAAENRRLVSWRVMSAAEWLAWQQENP